MIAHADYIAGLAKGLAVLESFSPERQRLNASQVAERTGLSRAAARRQLLTLEHLGYLESQDGQFWLAPKVLRLAGAYLRSARLPRLLQPVLDRLALATDEACSAVVLDGAQVVIVARSMPAAGRNPAHARSAPMQFAQGLHLGARLAAHATSTGRMLLACLRPRDLSTWLNEHSPLARLTAHTTTDPKALRRLVEQARLSDHCVAHEEHELGVHALAVPVRNLAGEAVAALNVVTRPERLQPGPLERELLPALQAATRELLAQV
ncbi:MAG: helix-turn-helix domain-containing protein [Rubrivivax sp.]|nr:helix-turn-helix domain-containing protein [Rubrivivax sp.]